MRYSIVVLVLVAASVIVLGSAARIAGADDPTPAAVVLEEMSQEEPLLDLGGIGPQASGCVHCDFPNPYNACEIKGPGACCIHNGQLGGCQCRCGYCDGQLQCLPL